MRFAHRFPILTVFATFFVQACATDSHPDRLAEFAPYAVPCSGYGEACLSDLLAREIIPFREVHGFAFEWGVRQRVRLKPHYRDPKVDTTSWSWDVDTVEAKTPQPDWSFRTRLSSDSTLWLLAGETLAIRAYPFPITILDPGDQARILGNRGRFPASLRISPSAGGLRGDSARVESPALPD